VENNTLYSFSERGVASSNYTTDIGEFKAAPEFLGRAALAAIRYESKIIAAGVEHSEGIYLVAKNLSAEEISILLKENIRKAINFVQQFL
jgi:hypothetical protein